ncbi:hypothetical protein ABK730_17870 [Klebsiella indica]|uniref:hypothetical protein n=1 Tax=Klebsiella TaxID=570 RepID=UPI0014867B6D|nr:hypothetical protein [Klebsiella indica]
MECIGIKTFRLPDDSAGLYCRRILAGANSRIVIETGIIGGILTDTVLVLLFVLF